VPTVEGTIVLTACLRGLPRFNRAFYSNLLNTEEKAEDRMLSDGAAYFPAILAEQSDAAIPKACSHPLDHAGSREATTVNPTNAHHSDEVLLAEIVDGSKEALGVLFRRYRCVVLSVARRILRDASEAEDLCQEVFLLLFQKAKLFDPNKGTASSWIIQIVYHRAMNRRQYLTHRQHYNTQELDEEQIGGERQPLLIDEIAARNLLNRLREQLSEEQREALELHFFEGYSLREIAEKTNQTLGNVRHHFYRGIERLRSNLFPQKDA
jgi:RNA polymerase sigma-70 factor, ECF subfamily